MSDKVVKETVEYDIKANISSFEWRVVQYLRSLREYGWGHLHVAYYKHCPTSCERTFTDGGGDLKEMVEDT